MEELTPSRIRSESLARKESNAKQIIILTKSWDKLDKNSKITLHSFLTGGSQVNFKPDQMLHNCVKELWNLSSTSNTFKNFTFILKELSSSPDANDIITKTDPKTFDDISETFSDTVDSYDK